MFSVHACPLPESALLSKYGNLFSIQGVRAYTDCYSIEIAKPVNLSEFVFAFYTTPVFSLERIILKYLVSKPSTDEQARQVADGSTDFFAAWTVEQRNDTQLLMCDFQERTRSWFMVTPSGSSSAPQTLLQFGSAVVHRKNIRTGKLELGGGAYAPLGFHKLYSKVLLHSAKKRLESHYL